MWYLSAVGHMFHYYQPELQRHCIRIILMVPIYAAESWFALRFKDYAIVWESLRSW